MRRLTERVGLPYDLPSAADARATARGASGPLKPALVAAFGPRRYDCRGERGIFTLQRWTSRNHVPEVQLDVGRGADLSVRVSRAGFGFDATLVPTVTARDVRVSIQLPGDHQGAANVAAIADEPERTFDPRSKRRPATRRYG